VPPGRGCRTVVNVLNKESRVVLNLVDLAWEVSMLRNVTENFRLWRMLWDNLHNIEWDLELVM
jgi:hypothetical protein